MITSAWYPLRHLRGRSRPTLWRSRPERARVPEATLGDLETKAKLVRRERRREVYFYEIASEFLVDWIRRQARRRRERMLEAKARKEKEQAEEQRRQAEERAQDEKKRADEQARLAQRLGYFSIALAVVMVLAAIAGVYAWRQQLVAKEQQQIAETQKRAAEKQQQIAESQRQAAEEQRQRAEGLQQLAEQQRRLAGASEQRRTDELFQSQLTQAALLADEEKYAEARDVLKKSRESRRQDRPGAPPCP